MVSTAKTFVDRHIFVKTLRGEDCVGRNPTERERKVEEVGVLVDDEYILTALSRHCGNAHFACNVSAARQRRRRFKVPTSDVVVTSLWR